MRGSWVRGVRGYERLVEEEVTEFKGFRLVAGFVSREVFYLRRDL
jgi:hypothetical protein